MVIKWSDFAKLNIKDFINNSKLSTPQKYIEELVNTTNVLLYNPRAGKILFKQNGIPTRQLIFKMHRIIYKVIDDEIHVGAVLHIHQDFQEALKFIKTYFK